MQKPKVWVRLAVLGLAALLVAGDQLLKQWMTPLLAGGRTITLIPGVLGLEYTENTGISFSLFGASRTAMLIITGITALVMLAAIAALLAGKIRGKALLCGTALILAGGIGNLIDRFVQGYVVDYIEFLFMQFAIFNFADVCITCGVVLVAVRVLWDEFHKPKTADASADESNDKPVIAP